MHGRTNRRAASIAQPSNCRPGKYGSRPSTQPHPLNPPMLPSSSLSSPSSSDDVAYICSTSRRSLGGMCSANRRMSMRALSCSRVDGWIGWGPRQQGLRHTVVVGLVQG